MLIMTEERIVTVDGIPYCVVISDEREALLAAKAAGRVFVGLAGENGGADLWEAEYLVETSEVADDTYLERVVRRSRHLPWVIAESERLCIREFTVEDALQIPDENTVPADEVFYTQEKLEAYIASQYRFYEYGIWAVVRKSDGKIVGKAGLSDCDTSAWGIPGIHLELGYHIFQPWRRQGYACEACRLILEYAGREYSAVYAVVDADNTASRKLLCKLGFEFMAETGSGAAVPRCLYSRYWR